MNKLQEEARQFMEKKYENIDLKTQHILLMQYNILIHLIAEIY